jgi:integrase
MNPALVNILPSDALPPKRATFGGRMTRRRSFQEGSLFKRGTRKKVWVGRWWEPVIGPDNVPGRIRRSEVLGPVAEIPTIREARQKLSDLLRKINSGEYRPQTVWTFGSFVKDRWKPEVFPTLKHSTKLFYSTMIDAHLNPVFEDTQLRLITKDSVQNFLKLKAQSGLSWKTVKHIRTLFGTIIEAAVKDDFMADNPVRRTRPPRHGPVEEKSPIEMETVKELIEKLPEPSRSIAALLARTGLRIGELLALRWQDTDLLKGFLSVNQTVYEGHFDEPKSRRSKRRIPLGPKCVEILAALKRTEATLSTLVFSARNGSPLSRRNLLNRQLKPAAKALKLTGVNWHWFRHAHATLLDSTGAPIGTTQALLGHSSSEITRGTYIHSVPADARQAVEDVERLLGTKGSLIGPKWTQIPIQPGNGNPLIN